MSSFNFDKFIKDLEERERLLRERLEQQQHEEEQWSQRERVKLYREHHLNRVFRKDTSND